MSKTEKYDATVMTTEDPEQRGRIKVACAGLLGDEDTELPQWIEPNLQWGWFVVPDVGEIVEIETLFGDEQEEIFGQSFLENAEMRWSGKRSWTDEETENGEPRPIPEEFVTNYGKRRGFATPNGHIIFFDDTKDGQKINITWHQNGTYQFIAMDEKGSMTVANANGTMIYMDSENGAFTIIDEHGNHYSSDENGIKIVDNFSNFIEWKDGVIQIVSQGNVVFLGADCTIGTGSVNILDGATDKLVMGDTFKSTVYDIHTHATAFGPSGPPTPLLLPTALSQNAKVGP
jgi:hypothetical protein